MSSTLLATYDTSAKANDAIHRLVEQGFQNEQMSLMVSDSAKEKHLAIETGTKAPEGAAGGAVAGGALGAIAAGLTAAAGIVIPGIGFAIAGPLAAALAGLGAGGAAGGLVGGLVGLGFKEAEAKIVEDEIKKGNIVLAVTHDDRDHMKAASDIFEKTKALSTIRA